jgi:Holliday junction DNA helicase RuvB
MEEAERITTADNLSEDLEFSGLRPKKLNNFIGQEKLKGNLRIHMEAARARGDVLEHILFYGPPGLGKTTLAGVVANEMGVSIRITSGPAIERPGDLAAILTNLKERDILFIDEIHRLNHVVEEVLYPAMEDFGLDIVIGKGPSARSIRLDLPRFTLIGATTRAGLISAPLRDRFGMAERLDFYSEGDLEKIINNCSGILNIKIDSKGAKEIAKRARGTPRIANRLLKRVRDFAQVKAKGEITKEVADSALDNLEIDALGLDKLDRSILSAIIDKFDGGPVGIETLSASVSEEEQTIEDVYEPYLMQIGYIERTQRGRIATAAAYEHLGKNKRGGGQDRLFK